MTTGSLCKTLSPMCRYDVRPTQRRRLLSSFQYAMFAFQRGPAHFGCVNNVGV
jgi:hypothetical protein